MNRLFQNSFEINQIKHFLSLVIFLTAFVVYLPHIHNAFNADAIPYAVGQYDETHASFWSHFLPGKGKHYAPFNSLLNVTLFHFLGDAPQPYRLVNVLLLAIAGSLSFILALSVTRKTSLSFWAGVFFVLHPFTAEFMNHVTMNIILIMYILMTLSMLSVLKALECPENPFYLIFSAVLFFMALLCQELAILFPLYLFTMLYFNQKGSFKRAVEITRVYFFTAFLFMSGWILFNGSSSGIFDVMTASKESFFKYSATFSSLVFWYLENFIYPSRIVFIYNQNLIHHDVFFWNSILILLILVMGYLCARYKNIKTLGLLLFAVNVMIVLPACLSHPYLGLVIEPYWFIFGQFGLCLTLAAVVNDLPAPRGRTVIYVSLTIFYLCLSLFYCRLGKTSLAHTSFWITHTKNNYIALGQYAGALMAEKKFDEALPIYLDLFERVDYYPDHSVPYNLNRIYTTRGEYEKADFYLEKAKIHYPDIHKRYFKSWSASGYIEK